MAKIIEMPKLGFDMAEGTLMNWVKAEGEKIKKGETLAEIETDKATVQVESTESGVIYKQLVEPHTTLPIGTPIAVIADEGEKVNLDQLLGGRKATADTSEKPKDNTTAAAPPDAPAVQESSEDAGDHLKASPVAKAMAYEKGVDLAAITGSGPGGRVVKRDVENALKSGNAVSSASPRPESSSGQDKIVAISKLRLAIGRRMQDSKHNIPAFYLTRGFDVRDLVNMRKQMNEERNADQKLSLNDFVIKATALALRAVPNLNASLSENEIIQHGNVNVGSAVAVEGGLLTVVVRNADRKSVQQIADETRQLFQRARDGKLRSEDVEGSTFTISNLGMYAVDEFIAIINPPEAAILAVGAAQEIPVVENGVVKSGWRMKATLSADHRITDGAEAAQFLQQLAGFIEQPWRLLGN